MWTKARKYVVPLVLIIVSFTLAYFIYGKYEIGKPIEDSDLITHYGLFLGFGLTIYTFVISVLDNITKRIDSNGRITNKDKITDNVFSSVKHLKQDVFAIFIIFVMQFVIMLVESSVNISDTLVIVIKQALFIYSLIILFDICSVLFGISEISLTLLKNRKSEKET